MGEKKRMPSPAELARQIAAARELGRQHDIAGLHARQAWYDPACRRLMVILTDNILVGFPIDKIPALATFTDAQLQRVSTSPGGMGLRWDAEDMDLEVEGLIVSHFGPRVTMAAMGRAAGQVKSPAKAKAARENGKKGGRPRKQVSKAKTANKAAATHRRAA